MDGPLGDIRVLDLTIARAGPTCVRQLADWGADVVRIEPPGPDGSGMGARHGSDFQNLHRNKRSLALDLKSEEGRAVFLRMVADADVVVENMRPQAKHHLQVDYESLRAINPRIVYGSISGLGQDGPLSRRGGYDQIAQGMGGLMSITGEPGGGPLRVGVAIADVAAGLYLAIGVLAALHERERSGEGQWVTTSLLESMIGMLDFQAARWTMDGVVPTSEGNHHPTQTPMGCFATGDGHINIGASAPHLWRSFCEAVGLGELVDDPRFARGAARYANREELIGIIEERLATRPTSEWVEMLSEAGVPAGPVYAMDEVFADPQVRHLGMEVPVAHPTLGELSLVRNAVSMSRSPSPAQRPSPDPGEHSGDVLRELGYSDEEIERLRSAGVV